MLLRVLASRICVFPAHLRTDARIMYTSESFFLRCPTGGGISQQAPRALQFCDVSRSLFKDSRVVSVSLLQPVSFFPSVKHATGKVYKERPARLAGKVPRAARGIIEPLRRSSVHKQNRTHTLPSPFPLPSLPAPEHLHFQRPSLQGLGSEGN